MVASFAKGGSTHERDPDYPVTVVALVAYVAMVGLVLVLLDID